MGLRTLALGLAVTSALASSCASTARDTLLDIYHDGELASSSEPPESCRIDARTFETATDAYVIQHGAPPAVESDLVGGYLRESPDAWQFDASVTTSYVPIADGRCDGFDVERNDPQSIGQTAVDAIVDGNSAGCVADKRLIQTALETHYVFHGYDATTLADLEEFGVGDEADRWTLQVADDDPNAVPTIVAVVGGPCDS